MPFYIIKGTFHVLGTCPRGDSIDFRADDESNWRLLGTNPQVVLKGTARTAQVVLEAIDAPDIHFQPCNSVNGHYEPNALASAARASMLQYLGIGSVTFDQMGVAVQADNEGARGYILVRSVDKHNKPIAFVYAGDPPGPSGSQFYLDIDYLRQSVNYQLIVEGLVYPTYYERLFPDLRSTISDAVRNARHLGRGIWVQDKTNKGVDIYDLAAVIDKNMILPKLFRRIIDYMDGGSGIEGFDDFLAAKQERVLTLPAAHFTHFDNVINIEGITVSLRQLPEDIVFLSD